MNELSLLGRQLPLFDHDIISYSESINRQIANASFLVIGGAGSIGQAVVKEIFSRQPKRLHVVDISENNLVELVRDLRSSFGYILGEFKTFALDAGSTIYDTFINADGQYDYVLNLSALKHVRSEKDPYTLMRMIDVNIFNTIKTIRQSATKGTQKYFAVSTDKAANPVSMMGASKRIMEMYLMRESQQIDISTARFANVAFSDGSLLHGFNQRLHKEQPIVAPNDVKRYFVTPKEAGELCLLSCLLGENRDIFFPKFKKELHLITFSDIAINYLEHNGYEPYLCQNEEEARKKMKELKTKGYWPCLFMPSDTTGEKDYEEFYMETETVNYEYFEGIGIVKNGLNFDVSKLEYFENRILNLTNTGNWTKNNVVELFLEMIPDFGHKEKGKYLDDKM